MEQADKVLELIEARDVGRLARFILQTDVFLENRDLAYRLWDAFLPEYERPPGARFPISDVTMGQIENDLHRSLHSITDIERDRIAFDRQRLGRLLYLFFETPYYEDTNGRQQELHYYQSLHDLASIMILRFGLRRSQLLLDRLARSHLRDFMDEDFSHSRLFTQEFIRVLLSHADPPLARRLRKIEMPPMFLVSWVLSWLCHDLNNFERSARTMDILVMLPPAAVGYVSVALLKAIRSEIMQVNIEYGSEEWGLLHQRLKELPKTQWSPNIFTEAIDMLQRHPPSMIIREVPELQGSSFDLDLPVAFRVSHTLLALFGVPLLVAILAFFAGQIISAFKE